MCAAWSRTNSPPNSESDWFRPIRKDRSFGSRAESLNVIPVTESYGEKPEGKVNDSYQNFFPLVGETLSRTWNLPVSSEEHDSTMMSSHWENHPANVDDTGNYFFNNIWTYPTTLKIASPPNAGRVTSVGGSDATNLTGLSSRNTHAKVGDTNCFANVSETCWPTRSKIESPPSSTKTHDNLMGSSSWKSQANEDDIYSHHYPGSSETYQPTLSMTEIPFNTTGSQNTTWNGSDAYTNYFTNIWTCQPNQLKTASPPHTESDWFHQTGDHTFHLPGLSSTKPQANADGAQSRCNATNCDTDWPTQLQTEYSSNTLDATITSLTGSSGEQAEMDDTYHHYYSNIRTHQLTTACPPNAEREWHHLTGGDRSLDNGNNSTLSYGTRPDSQYATHASQPCSSCDAIEEDLNETSMLNSMVENFLQDDDFDEKILVSDNLDKDNLYDNHLDEEDLDKESLDEEIYDDEDKDDADTDDDYLEEDEYDEDNLSEDSEESDELDTDSDTDNSSSDFTVGESDASSCVSDYRYCNAAVKPSPGHTDIRVLNGLYDHISMMEIPIEQLDPIPEEQIVSISTCEDDRVTASISSDVTSEVAIAGNCEDMTAAVEESTCIVSSVSSHSVQKDLSSTVLVVNENIKEGSSSTSVSSHVTQEDMSPCESLVEDTVMVSKVLTNSKWNTQLKKAKRRLIAPFKCFLCCAASPIHE